MSGIVATLKAPLRQRGGYAEVLAGQWTRLSARELAEKPVYLERDGQVPLGDIFELKGAPNNRIRFVGNLELANQFAAGLTEGEVIVEGNLGAEAGIALAGGALDIHGDAGPRTGAAPLGFNRGMTAGELIVRGSAGAEAAAGMRRGLVVIVGNAASRAGLGMIAGNVVVFGSAGVDCGLWSKRGTVVALGAITPPVTYSYACTYQPPHLKLLLKRLKVAYGLPVRSRHLTGFYRRYSGDMAELGKGEILEWSAK
jgi:formylmethanofuran dehydrogenase subunit C